MSGTMQMHIDAVANTEFTSENLNAERTGTRPLYIMQIVKSSNMMARDREHKEAEPFVARKLKVETRKIITALTKENKDAYAAALTDDDFVTAYRGGMGFTVNSPKTIYEILCTQQHFAFTVMSSTNISYDLRFAKYEGKAIMKAKDKDARNFGFGEIPPTAMQHANINTVDAVRESFKAALIKGGMEPTKIEPRENAAGKTSNEWRLEWAMPKDFNRFNLYLAYKVPLPSGDEGTISFSGEFCEKFNLHKYCGRPNHEYNFDRFGTHDRPECMFCEKRKSTGKAKAGKRSFDDMFGDLN